MDGHYGGTRPDMAPGCKENFDWEFLGWIWNFKYKSRLAVLERLKKLKKNQRVIILRTPGEVKKFLESLPKQ